MKYNQELLLTPVTKAHGLLRDIKWECEIKANLYSKKQIENMLKAAKANIDEAEQILRKRKFNSDTEPLLNKADVSSIQEFLEQKLKRKMLLVSWNVDGPENQEERLQQIEAIKIVLKMIEDE